MQVLVDAGLEHHAGVIHALFLPPQDIVQHAQGGSAVTADESPGIQADGAVDPGLFQRQSGQGLGAADKNTAVVFLELVSKRYSLESEVS